MAVVATIDDKRRTFAGNRAFGRIGLTVAAVDGRSRRARVYEDGALRVRFPNGDHLEAVTINTAGGMTGGDHFQIDMAVGEGADLAVTTAAAEKIYRSLGEDATIDVKLAAGPGAMLRWLPQETILFDAARLRRSIEVDVADGASILLAEAVVFGRTAMGETISAGRIFDRWRVRRAGRLIFAETMRLDGAIAQKLASSAIANGGCAVATVLLAPADATVVEPVRALQFSGEVGISAWNGFALARLVARDGDILRRDLKLLLATLGARLPRLWLH